MSGHDSPQRPKLHLVLYQKSELKMIHRRKFTVTVKGLETISGANQQYSIQYLT